MSDHERRERPSAAFGGSQRQKATNGPNHSNKGFEDEDGSDRKMWTEKYEFVALVRDISVPIFLSFASSNKTSRNKRTTNEPNAPNKRKEH